ncbi:MAG: hypothetical protein HQK61_04030 [Desulfamplus sp.]|nr:hypothetical protein [Desulfamplus sp.]
MNHAVGIHFSSSKIGVFHVPPKVVYTFGGRIPENQGAFSEIVNRLMKHAVKSRNEALLAPSGRG